jgi:hypothetical protein
MADTYYAWSRILYGVEKNDDGSKKNDLAANPGDEVSASSLDISDEQFKELVASGAVRDYPFPPELQDPLTSPNTLIAQGLADSETVASTYGVSPELVDAYTRQRRAQQTPTQGEVAPDGTTVASSSTSPKDALSGAS